TSERGRAASARRSPPTASSCTASPSGKTNRQAHRAPLPAAVAVAGNGACRRKDTMSDFDLVVVGDCNADLLVSGGDVVPAFAQQERLVDRAHLTIGGSGGICAAGAARL